MNLTPSGFGRRKPCGRPCACCSFCVMLSRTGDRESHGLKGLAHRVRSHRASRDLVGANPVRESFGAGHTRSRAMPPSVKTLALSTGTEVVVSSCLPSRKSGFHEDIQDGKSLRPLWLGGLIAPWAGPLLLFIWMVSWLQIREGTHRLEDWGLGFLAIAVFGMPPSYAGMWLLGMPYVFWLRRVGRLSALNVCIGSVVTGSTTFACFSLISKPELMSTSALLVWIGAGAAFGLPAGMAFCWVTGIGRRD